MPKLNLPLDAEANLCRAVRKAKKPGVVAACFWCSFGYTKYNHKLENEHFANVCPQCSRNSEGEREEETGMRRRVHPDLEFTSGERRVALTLVYLKMAYPDIDHSTRTKLAGSLLSLIDDHDSAIPQKKITDAHAVEMVWRHSQCVRNQTGRCPLLVFGRQLAEEINEFFTGDE
jgi:hypothetical protein